jgi:hypothetical protein
MRQLLAFRSSRRPTVISLTALCALMPLLAQAQAPQKSPTSASANQRTVALKDLRGDSQKSFELGVTLYRNGDKKGARAAFLEAYENSKNPRLLYNVAICERDFGRYPAAAEFFERELQEGRDFLSASEKRELESAIEQLKSVIGFLKVTSSEPGATVSIVRDGAEEELGKTPMKDPVAVSTGGPYFIVVRKAGFEPVTFRANFESQKVFDKSVTLESVVRSTDLEVQIEGPTSASIEVDGNERGAASAGSPFKGKLSVTPEPHVVTASADGFVTARQTVVAKEGEKVALRMALARKADIGRLDIQATPEGAIIVVDRAVKGQTRWSGTLPVGPHQIVVKKDGYYTRSYDIEVRAGTERTVSANLDENRSIAWVGWALGTALVIGGSATAGYFIFRAKEPDIPGSLRLQENTPVPAGFRFR